MFPSFLSATFAATSTSATSYVLLSSYSPFIIFLVSLILSFSLHSSSLHVLPILSCPNPPTSAYLHVLLFTLPTVYLSFILFPLIPSLPFPSCPNPPTPSLQFTFASLFLLYCLVPFLTSFHLPSTCCFLVSLLHCDLLNNFRYSVLQMARSGM